MWVSLQHISVEAQTCCAETKVWLYFIDQKRVSPEAQGTMQHSSRLLGNSMHMFLFYTELGQCWQRISMFAFFCVVHWLSGGQGYVFNTWNSWLSFHNVLSLALPRSRCPLRLNLSVGHTLWPWCLFSFYSRRKQSCCHYPGPISPAQQRHAVLSQIKVHMQSSIWSHFHTCRTG